MHRRLRGLRLLVVLVPAVLLATGLFVLDRPAGASPDAPPPGDDSSALPPGTAGMRYTLNPDGGLGAAQAPLPLDPATSNALRRDDVGLVAVTHPNGAVSVNLQGRFQSAAVAHIGPDGVVTVCVDDPQAAAAASTSDEKPAPKREEQ